MSGAVRYGAVAANLCSAAVANQGSGKRCGYLCVRSVFNRAGFCPPGAVLNHGAGGGGGSGAVRRLSGPVRPVWQPVCGYPEIYGDLRRRRQWGLALFSYEVLSLFYGTSSPDLVLGCHQLLFWFAFTALPAALSSTCVFALQALGYAKRLLLPFSLTAVLRVGLNFLLIPNGRFHLYGSAVSTAVSFLFLSVYCLVLMRRITKVKFSRTEVFAKPVLAVIFTCLTVKGVAGVFFTQLQNTWNFVLSAVLFSAVLTILLLLFGTLSTKDLHFAGER